MKILLITFVLLTLISCTDGLLNLGSGGGGGGGGGGGSGMSGDAARVIIYTSEGVWVAGDFTSISGTVTSRVAFLDTFNAAVMGGFASGNGFNDRVYAALVYTQGVAYFGGAFTSYDTSAAGRIARVHTDGVIDTNFVGTGFDNTVRALTSDALITTRLYAGGEFTSYNGLDVSDFAIRVNSNGSRDATFAPAQLNGIVLAVEQELAGNRDVYLGGEFTTSGASNRSRIIRVNTLAGTDPGTFTPGTGFNALVNSIVHIPAIAQSYIGGAFSTYSGNQSQFLAAVNTSGIGGNFFPGFINGNVNKVDYDTAIDRVYIAGEFTTVNLSARSGIARLHTTGALDTDFTVGTGFNGPVYGFDFGQMNQVYVAGDFTDFDGTSVGKVALLNSDGSLDTSFDTTN